MACISMPEYLQEKLANQNGWEAALHEYEVGVWILVAVICVLSAIIFLLLFMLCKLKRRLEPVVPAKKTENLELQIPKQEIQTDKDKIYPDISVLEEVC